MYTYYISSEYIVISFLLSIKTISQVPDSRYRLWLIPSHIYVYPCNIEVLQKLFDLYVVILSYSLGNSIVVILYTMLGSRSGISEPEFSSAEKVKLNICGFFDLLLSCQLFFFGHTSIKTAEYTLWNQCGERLWKSRFNKYAAANSNMFPKLVS